MIKVYLKSRRETLNNTSDNLDNYLNTLRMRLTKSKCSIDAAEHTHKCLLLIV